MKKEKEFRILMLEDSMDDIELIKHVLRKSELPFVSQHVDTREEFEHSINSFNPDIVLSDHGLPQFNSMEALKICMKERASTPFIIVTGTMSDEFAISCLNLGADDYILKSNLSRLPLAIHRAIKERRLERLKREARHALRHQNTELMKVNTELDNFVYSVSHNLRGPLASVMGLLNVARIEDRDDKLASLHSMMESSINKLDTTLKEIIAYSKNAHTEVVAEPIDWWQEIEKSLVKLEHLPLFDSVHIVKEFQTPTPFLSDSHRIRAILTNLLHNSISYADVKKESRVIVRIENNHEHAIIEVIDNGKGINEKVLPKIFDMFFRGNEESTGAGLGLYITKEVVKKLHGEIIITSQAGVGTKAWVKIPVV